MPLSITAVNSFLNLFRTFKEAFSSLKKSNLLLKETNLYDIIERYFAFEDLPQQHIKLSGKLSNYTLATHFPVYSVLDTKQTQERVIQNVYDTQLKKFTDKVQFSTVTAALQIPCINSKSFTLYDGSQAQLLWLYPQENHGLSLNMNINKLDDSLPLQQLFNIENSDKPIPVLVDAGLAINQFLYTQVNIIGKIITAPITVFETLFHSLNSFQISYFGNCFRPFSNNEGILAIDLRKPNGKISKLSDNKSVFPITYTVQGIIDIGNKKNVSRDDVYTCCANAIPDRQGMGAITAFNSGPDCNTSSILSIGDISWQFSRTDNIIGAFTNINLNDTYDVQTKLTKLSYHYQAWQKKAREIIRNKFFIEPKITPLICSNSNHEKSFHPNGLQIPENLEKIILSNNPEIRTSIDWLGISTGKI